MPIQLDIGFGNVVTPGPTDIEYPGLLDFPAPVLREYPKETVVAEKLEALTALGLLNSRMKDFYDLACSTMYPFEGVGSWVGRFGCSRGPACFAQLSSAPRALQAVEEFIWIKCSDIMCTIRRFYP